MKLNDIFRLQAIHCYGWDIIQYTLFGNIHYKRIRKQDPLKQAAFKDPVIHRMKANVSDENPLHDVCI